jgi:hypothetical protein
MEDLQIVEYDVSGYFKQHYDPTVDDKNSNIKDRAYTLLFYLNNVEEVDLIEDIKEDSETTQQEKQELIKTYRKSKSRLSLTYQGDDISMDVSTETYLLCLKKITEQTSWDMLMKNEIRVTKTLEELKDRNPSADSSQLKSYDGHYIFTGNNNDVKCKILNKLIRKLDIKDLQVGIKK